MNSSVFFGKKLRELRKSRNLTAGQLAPHLHCSSSLIYNIEKGINRPQPELIVDAAEFFRVTTDYMLREEDVKKEEELIKLYRKINNRNKLILFNISKLLIDQD